MPLNRKKTSLTSTLSTLRPMALPAGLPTLLPMILFNIFFVPITTANEKKAANTQDIIVVTANRNEKTIWDSTISVSAVNRDEIEKQNGDSIVEALRDIPGVEIMDNALAGRKQIMIRGESSSRILMLIDGQEVTYHRSGHGSSAGVLIDMESVERIEVIKGPHSVLYGSQAIGGVVNFITRKRSRDQSPFNGHTKFIYNGATDGLSEMGSLYGSIDGIFDYRISGSYSEQGDRKAYIGRLNDTDFDNSSLSAWLGLNLDKHKFGLSLDRYKLDTQTYYERDPNDPSLKEFFVKIPNLEREKVGLFYDYDVDGTVVKKIHFDAYAQKLQREFRNHVLVSPMPIMSIKNNTATDDEQKTYGMTLQANLIPYQSMSLITGIQYQQDNVDQDSNNRVVANMPVAPASYTENRYSHNKWQQTTIALFAQNDWAITDDFSLNLGFRQYWLESELKNGSSTTVRTPTMGPSTTTTKIDNNRKDSNNNFVVSSGITYAGFDHTQLRASFAQGYVYPTLSHLYAVTSAHTQTIYGNPDLEAEKSNNYEIGLRYNNNQWLVDSAVYYSTAKNYITEMACNGSLICDGGSGANITYYGNANRAKTYGMELSLEYLDWDVIPYIRANYLRRQIETDTYTTYDTGNPRFTGTLGVKHTAYFEQADIEADLFMRVATHATNRSDAAVYYYPGWSTLNLSTVASFGPKQQYQIGFDLNNILNKNYTTAYETIPAAKFHVVISTSIKF